MSEDTRVCNYCNGTGLEEKPDWLKAQEAKLLELNVREIFAWPFLKAPEGLQVSEDQQLCFGCHGRKRVPNCPHCAKGPLMVRCGTCAKEFELVPWCMNRMLPLAGAHIRYGPNSQYVEVGERQYVDFCSPGCKAGWVSGAVVHSQYEGNGLMWVSACGISFPLSVGRVVGPDSGISCKLCRAVYFGPPLPADELA